jgi:peptide/nickel transport system permease protein
LLRLILLRVASGLATLALLSVLVFWGVEALPGNAATATLGQQGVRDPQQVREYERELGLDRPATSRYADWVSGIVQGDLGTSASTRTPVSELVGRRLANTATLIGITMLVLIPLGVALGVLAGVRRYGRFDSVATVLTVIASSLPEFVIGVLLVVVFALTLPIFPAVSVFDPESFAWQHPVDLVLPVVTLVLGSLSLIFRMTRVSVIETMSSNFVHMLRLRGIPEPAVVRRHVLPNSLVPTIQASALTVAYLIGAVVTTEVVFSYPGIGSVMVDAVANRDIPVIQALALILAAIYILVVLLADVLTILVTPRLRTAVS